jgi:hypothetical protein
MWIHVRLALQYGKKENILFLQKCRTNGVHAEDYC